ncbi:SDR family NAD(P)-dependent oxidoreductase [Mesorhizobium sp. ANAO-SY3R2]|uniref:SDR family NAD(P)-dependent oxidoreductase n=1 Tax=Mesorhizobium sp. ANAO-SY3R2 TaxID=3166644 RepID=UPI0036724C09
MADTSLAGMADSLLGKITLVSGGGAGIGRAIALAYGRCGAVVVVAEKDAGRADKVRAELDVAGVTNIVVCCDVTDREAVDKLMALVADGFGRLDVLVNNVGDFLGVNKPFAETTRAEWNGLYGVNLEHIFLMTHAALPLLRRGENASIINISTIEAFRGIPNFAVYSAFKTAITGFTKSLALELAPENIRVNAIAPETTETEQIQILKWIPEEHQHMVKRWMPLGRYGQPDDSAGAALFLASNLSSWITGTTINLDGGALAAGGWRQTADGTWTNRPVITAHAHKG